MAKKIVKIIKNNWMGVVCALALAFIVAVATDFSPVILILIFLPGYFVIGVLVELIIKFFAVEKKKSGEIEYDKNSIVPDNSAKKEMLGKIRREIVVDLSNKDDSAEQ